MPSYDKKINKYEYINVFLKDDSNQSPKIIFSKKGFLINHNNNKILRLLDGKLININNEGKSTYFNFDQTDFDLSTFGTKTTVHQKIKEMPLLDLINCVFYFSLKKNVYKYDPKNCNIDSINEVSQEVYSRVFKPLNLFLL